MPKILQALTSAFGDELTQVGGVRITRLLALTPAGSTQLSVERSIDLPATGKVLIDGVSYTYSGNLDGTLTGIAYVLGGQSVSGTRIVHQPLAAVVDVSQTYSVLDSVRASLLLGLATGRDLDVIGRNLGVPRLPNLTSDSVYTGIIQSLAYCPRGTVFGLTSALNALLGAGNFTVFEDLVNYPNQVFVRVPIALQLYANQSIGKAYLTPQQVYQSSASEAAFVGSGSYARGYSVSANTESFVTNCRTALPTTQTLPAQYTGDTGQVVWSNANESTYAVVVTTYGGATQLQGTGICQWTHNLNTSTTGTWAFSMLAAFPTGTTMPATGVLVIQVYDGARLFQLNFVAGTPSGWTLSSNVAALSYTAGLSFAVPYEVTLARVGQNTATATVELRINGVAVASAPYSAGVASATAPQIVFGRATASSAALQFKQVAVSADDPVDYWPYRTTAAQVQASAPQTVTLQTGVFAAGDVGKQIKITGSAAVNASGGNNNTTAQIASVTSSAAVVVTGPPLGPVVVSSAAPQTLTVSSVPRAFTYPDDLGKQITLSGSGVGNNGTFTISNLIDVGTGRDLSSFATALSSTTNICKVAGATFVTETVPSSSMRPVFVNENVGYGASLSVELSDAAALGTPTSGTYPVTFRAGATLPRAARRWRVKGNTVLGADVLWPPTLSNQALGGGLYSYYPFYVNNPFALLTAYVKQALPAGVQLNIVTY